MNWAFARGIRGRIALLLVGGLLLAACGFYGLLDFLARDWSRRELREQGEAVVERMAREAVTPLVLGDRRGLQMIVSHGARDRDAVGAAILGANGAELATRVTESDHWTQVPVARLDRRPGETRLTRERSAGVEVFTLVVPVIRTAPASTPTGDAFDFNESGPGPGAARTPELLGWVRLTYSTARLEGELSRARTIGLLILSLVVALGLAASLAMLRVVVRPLREASGLAREIAGGNLDRRIPVRAGDELGALAASMNTMA
ncbi:MAG TPA: HAMP domain-containing protein, partial [Candidatus Eisenbacteria bacterium]|nr:HAMP domain-containing protein [Candidatus Eisenbacteria bacterium]